MADKPIEVTVEKTLGTEAWTGNDGPMATDEILFSGDGRTWKIHRPAADPQPSEGDTLRGWKNEGKGTFGIAKDRPLNGAGRGSRSTTSTGRRDPEETASIQRQTAAKCAAEMAAAVGGNGPVVLANFEEMFKTVHGLIVGNTAKADAENV